MNSGHPLQSPLPIFLQADQWFSRANASLLGALPCHKGCHHCCIGPFPITVLDREEIQRGLNNLPDDQRTDIEQRAREQIASLETRYPRLKKSTRLDEWDDAVIDQIVSDFAELPCPALDSDGSCRIYDARPLACRTMGIPTEDHHLVQGACEVQTFIPIRRLSQSLLEQEQQLVHREVQALEELRRHRGEGEEMLLAYGFIANEKSGT